MTADPEEYRYSFTPAGPHNPNLGPAVCLCLDCCREMLTRRCPWRNEDGHRCGDYKGHKGDHSILVFTVFEIAGERLLRAEREVDGPSPQMRLETLQRGIEHLLADWDDAVGYGDVDLDNLSDVMAKVAFDIATLRQYLNLSKESNES